MKKIKYYIFGFFVWVLFINGSCIIPWECFDCNIPVAKTIGVNDSFSITPLKDSYNSGKKIIVRFTIDSKARLYDDKDVVFDIFKKTKENEVTLFTDFSIDINKDIGSLIGDSKNNPRKYIIGRYYAGATGPAFLYQPDLDSYVLELEVTLLDKRKYIIDGFHLAVDIGRKPNDNNFYTHFLIMKFDPPISFEVK